MIKAIRSRILAAGALIVGIMTMLTWTLRLRVLWVRALKSVIGIGLRVWPGLYDAQDEHKRAYASGRVRDRREREKLCQLLQEAERAGMSPAQAVRDAGLEGDQKGQLTRSLARAIFGDVAPEAAEAAVQYSGGADSTVAAILAAHRFARVHLLSFYHPFILERGRAKLNADKLANIFGSDAIVHVLVDATQALDRMMFRDYWRDMRKYWTFPIGDACLLCKLSFDVGSIAYACENGIKVVVDGSDLRVPFQLSQGHEGMLELRREFYSEYGIDFRHPAARLEDTTLELIGFGLHSNPSCLIYPHQPHCAGNDALGAIYKRFYFLPKYGMAGLSEFAESWASEKLALCRKLLGEPARAPIPPARDRLPIHGEAAGQSEE